MKLIALAAAAVLLATSAQARNVERDQEARDIVALAREVGYDGFMPVMEMADTVCPIVRQSSQTYLPQLVAARAHFSDDQTLLLMKICTFYIMGGTINDFRKANGL